MSGSPTVSAEINVYLVNQTNLFGSSPEQSAPSHMQAEQLHAVSQYPSAIHIFVQPGAQSGTGQLKYVLWPRDRVMKSSGQISAPNITSSLRYIQCRLRPGILCRFVSIAGDEKHGRCDWFLKICLCVTSLRCGWSKFSQFGI